MRQPWAGPHFLLNIYQNRGSPCTEINGLGEAAPRTAHSRLQPEFAGIPTGMGLTEQRKSYAPFISGAELRSARVGATLGRPVNAAEVGFLRGFFFFHFFF
jgi:hypothetical protein